MKSLAIIVLSCIFSFLIVCIAIVAFAEESKAILSIPVITHKSGLTVESCGDDAVIITSPLEACRYISHTKRIDKKSKRVTVTVRCINDPQETTP